MKDKTREKWNKMNEKEKVRYNGYIDFVKRTKEKFRKH
jgi:hypothetical protein